MGRRGGRDWECGYRLRGWVLLCGSQPIFAVIIVQDFRLFADFVQNHPLVGPCYDDALRIRT